LGEILHGVDVCGGAFAGYPSHQFRVKAHEASQTLVRIAGQLFEGVPQLTRESHGWRWLAVEIGHCKWCIRHSDTAPSVATDEWLVGESDDDGINISAFTFGKCRQHRRSLTAAPLIVVDDLYTKWYVGDVDSASDDDDGSDVGFDRRNESVVNNFCPMESGEEFVAISREPASFSGCEHGNQEMGSRGRSHV
jgi:hypothetical protein